MWLLDPQNHSSVSNSLTPIRTPTDPEEKSLGPICDVLQIPWKALFQLRDVKGGVGEGMLWLGSRRYILHKEALVHEVIIV